VQAGTRTFTNRSLTPPDWVVSHPRRKSSWRFGEVLQTFPVRSGAKPCMPTHFCAFWAQKLHLVEEWSRFWLFLCNVPAAGSLFDLATGLQSYAFHVSKLMGEFKHNCTSSIAMSISVFSNKETNICYYTITINTAQPYCNRNGSLTMEIIKFSQINIKFKT